MTIDLRGVVGKTTVNTPRKTTTIDGKSVQNTHSSRISADTVNLTHMAQQLTDAKKTLASAPIVNAARVAEISQALHHGEYSVDAVHTAEKIIEIEGQLAS